MRVFFIAFFLIAGPAFADTIRVATFNASLSRNGVGVLIGDLTKDDDAQIDNVAAIIRTIRPDILLINEFDYDTNGRAADLFIAKLDQTDQGISYPHRFTSLPNTGQLSGHDLNDDGKIRGPEDAFGYGRFPGQYGMLLLSRFPVTNARSFAQLLWRDFPGARLPTHPDGAPYPSDEAQAAMRLSSKSHWDVAIDVPGLGPLHVFASHPTPPVFDGPEDRNGLRNGDEIRFWKHYVDGIAFTDDAGVTATRRDAPFVVLGDLNADPNDGDGDHSAIGALLNHPKMQDPKPASEGAGRAAQSQAGANMTHKTPPETDTVDWRDKGGPGNLRVDYVLPSADLTVLDAGTFWPAPQDPLSELLGKGRDTTSDHRLVWIDIDIP